MEYCDLNINAYNYEKSHNDQEYIKLIISCLKEGYYNFALNFEFSDLNKPIPKNTFKPVELSVIEEKLKEDISLAQYLPKLNKIQQLSRLTITINETKYLPLLQEGSKQLHGYDIIAVKTTNEKIFNEICINYDNFDIIQIDTLERQPSFILKRGHVQEAIKKGVYFEINYGDIFKNPDQKRVLFQNFMRIHKATKGKHLIINSGVLNHLHHRSPYDLVSLFNILEMKNDDTYAALKKNPLLCIQRSKYRKTFKGTVSNATEKDIDRFQQKRVQNLERINKKVQKMKEKLQQKKENNENVIKNLDERQKQANIKHQLLQKQQEDKQQQKQQQNEHEIQIKKKAKIEQNTQKKQENQEKMENEETKDNILGFDIDTNPNN